MPKVSEYISRELDRSNTSVPFSPVGNITVNDILTKLTNKYNTPYDNPAKIDWMNEAVDHLWRDIGLEDIYSFTTTEDVAIYQIPADMKFEKIRALTVSTSVEAATGDTSSNQIEYRAASNNEKLSTHCFFRVSENRIGLHPLPDKDGKVVRVMYRKDASTLSQVTDTINVRSDYIKAIVYYVCAEMAESLDDIAKHNNFITKYNDEVLWIKQDRYAKAGKFPVTKDANIKPTMSARAGNGRRRYGTHTIPEAGRLY